MVAFSVLATVLALACAGFVGWDAWRRPRPERAAWAIAFLVFALAAGAEVAGSALGWTPALARIYYLMGAVLVVGLLALGELYLLLGTRMPALTPGVTLLVVALSATTVWSAPIDPSRLATEGWGAIERGPGLVALAAAINAGGTAVLVGGALCSAWTLRGVGELRGRALGCALIAAGTIVVAAGGTLTRIGHREYLYLAMAVGISIIFAGVLLTRGKPKWRADQVAGEGVRPSQRAALVPLPVRSRLPAGVAFVVEAVLPLADDEVVALCRRWSATPVDGEALSRAQAKQTWTLRLALPDAAKARFDSLPLEVQAQIAELVNEVWSDFIPVGKAERRA